MKVEYDLQAAPGVAIGKMSGQIDMAGMERAARQMWAIWPSPSARMVWDLRDAQFDLTSAQIRQWSRFVMEHSPYTDLRQAFVAAGDVHFGMLRIFEATAARHGAAQRVFRDVEAAVAWVLAKD